jgi:hypothetical protein
LEGDKGNLNICHTEDFSCDTKSRSSAKKREPGGIAHTRYIENIDEQQQ